MANNQGSLARRVSIVGGLSLAGVLLLTSVLASYLLTRNAQHAVEQWVTDKTATIKDTVLALDASAKVMAQRSFGSFRQDFGPAFTLNEETGELRDWGPKLNDNYTAVDKFAALTNGVASVFALKGDGYERITTSAKLADGSRSPSTRIDAKSPVATAIAAGKTYTGRVATGGRSFMAYYEGVKNDAGKVVGLLAIGFDLEAFQGPLDQMIKDSKFFETGGVAIVENPDDAAKARFLAHPSAKGKLVKDVAPALLDRLAQGDKEASSFIIDDLPDMLGTQGQHLLGAVQRVKDGNLVIVAQVSRDESMKSHWAVMVPFWLLLVVATASLAGGLFWVMRRWIAEPLARLTHGIQAMAQGDLTRSIDSHADDEVGALTRDTEQMRQRLASTIGTVRQSVDSIGTASAEIATGNSDLSQRTEQTASNLQTAASSMSELTSTVRQTADAARTANQLVSSAMHAANKGGEVVGQVVSTMEDINTASRKIADIIGVIDGIAFQTNILALNAAVEAARAGEQGRGFAVVAGEVRLLAGRSAEAAKEIKALIGNSVERVDTGSRLVKDAGATMGEIVSSVRRVQDIMGEISSASGEQSEGIAAVNTSVVQLDQMTQQNAALVEQSAAAAESLKEQAHRLVEAVGFFQVTSGESRVSTPPAQRAPRTATVAPPRPAPSSAPRQTPHPTPRSTHEPATPPAARAPATPAPTQAGKMSKAAVGRPAAPTATASGRAAQATPPSPAKRSGPPAPAPSPTTEGDWETF